MGAYPMIVSMVSIDTIIAGTLTLNGLSSLRLRLRIRKFTGILSLGICINNAALYGSKTLVGSCSRGCLFLMNV